MNNRDAYYKSTTSSSFYFVLFFLETGSHVAQVSQSCYVLSMTFNSGFSCLHLHSAGHVLQYQVSQDISKYNFHFLEYTFFFCQQQDVSSGKSTCHQKISRVQSLTSSYWTGRTGSSKLSPSYMCHLHIQA